jgi:hypothetical protein
MVMQHPARRLAVTSQVSKPHGALVSRICTVIRALTPKLGAKAADAASWSSAGGFGVPSRSGHSSFMSVNLSLGKAIADSLVAADRETEDPRRPRQRHHSEKSNDHVVMYTVKNMKLCSCGGLVVPARASSGCGTADPYDHAFFRPEFPQGR